MAKLGKLLTTVFDLVGQLCRMDDGPPFEWRAVFQMRLKLPFILLVLGCLSTTTATFGQCVVPRDHHAWGRFQVGSWKRVLVITEDLDEKGEVVTTSRTETRTTLTSVDDETYTRRVDVTFKVAGKEFTAEPRLITKGLNGEDVGQSVTITKVGPGKVVVDGEEIASEVKRVVINGGNTKRITTIHYCDSKSPYVFKLETKATDAEGKETNYTSHVNVLDVDRRRKVLWQYTNTSLIKTVHQRPKGKTVTEEVYSSEIPGGVVSHKSTELDESGRVIRRSTLELLDFEVAVARESKIRSRFRDRKRSKKRPN